MSDKIILPEDAQVEYRTDLEGWTDGKYYYGKGPDGEERARYAASTHYKCRRGHINPKNTYCHECYVTDLWESYKAMPFKEWDGTTPLMELNVDRLFMDSEDVWCYLDEFDEEDRPDLMLVICERSYPPEITDEYWSDYGTEDEGIAEIYPSVKKAIDQVNEALKQVVAWEPGKFRTEVNFEEG